MSPALERFGRALDVARNTYVAATAAAYALPDPVERSRALAVAKAEHERAIATALAS